MHPDGYLKLKDMATSIIVSFMQKLYLTKYGSASDYKVDLLSPFNFFKFWKNVFTEKKTHEPDADLDFDKPFKCLYQMQDFSWASPEGLRSCCAPFHALQQQGSHLRT